MKKITKNIFESIEEYSNRKEIPEHLVNRIINFMKEFDLYDFRDNYETDEDAYNDIVYGTEEIVDYMKNIAEDEECLPELRKEAKSIFLMLTQGTDNEDLINAGREPENRINESSENRLTDEQLENLYYMDRVLRSMNDEDALSDAWLMNAIADGDTDAGIDYFKDEYRPTLTQEDYNNMYELYKNLVKSTLDGGIISRKYYKGKTGYKPTAGASDKELEFVKKDFPEIRILESDEITKKSDEVNDELLRYLYDDTDYEVSRDGKISNIDFPEYESFNDSVMEVSKKEFNKAKNKLENALNNIKLYNDSDGSGVYIELNDNHTMYNLEDNGKSNEDWYSIIDSKSAEFKAETGEELIFVGRSARHVCVELTLDNILNYNKLKEVQERLEDEAVEEFNNIEESTITEGTSSKRVAKYNEFDNGKVIHSWSDMSDEEAEEQARQASLKDDKDVYYVQYDNVMNPTSKYVWYKGERHDSSEADNIIKSMNESAELTAKVVYHDEDGTRDYIAGKLSDGRYFLIGQQEQIIVSDKDLPSLAKKDMDDFRYDEDGDKDFIEALENGTTLDKNSDLAKVIINASRKYLYDGCYLLSESTDINDALADDIKKVASIEPGSDEEATLNDISTPRYGITYDCIYRSGDLMARQFQIQSDESFSLLLKLNDDERGTWIDVNRVEPDDWSWDFNQYIFDNNNSIDEEAKKMQELIGTNYAEDVLQIIYEFARDYKLDKDDLEESDNSYWSSVPNEELMRIVSNLLFEYKGSKISKMINKVEGKINLLDLANKLEVDWEILLRTLEYMCSKGLAKEIDDSTYLILDNMKEYEELDTNNYKKFNHVNDVWNYLEASTGEEDLADRISEINPKEFGSIYYEKHKDGNGATVIIDYQDDNEDYYEKVDVYFDKEELDESVDNKEFELIEATDDDIIKLEDGSALTFEGLASDEDSLKAMIDFFKEKTKITIPAKIYHLTGAKMNSMYGLTGSNAYPDDLNIISLPLDNWKDIGNLPMIKFKIGARWFDDIVDNNRRRQENMNESIDEINNIEDNVEDAAIDKNAEVIKSKIEFDGEEPYFEKDGRKYYLRDYTFNRDNSIITLDDGMYKVDIEYGIDDYIVLRKMED